MKYFVLKTVKRRTRPKFMCLDKTPCSARICLDSFLCGSLPCKKHGRGRQITLWSWRQWGKVRMLKLIYAVIWIMSRVPCPMSLVIWYYMILEFLPSPPFSYGQLDFSKASDSFSTCVSRPECPKGAKEKVNGSSWRSNSCCFRSSSSSSWVEVN